MKRQRPSWDYPSRPVSRAAQAKRPRTWRSNTAAIVRREMKKKQDLLYTDTSQLLSNVSATGNVVSLFTNLVRGDSGFNEVSGNSLVVNGVTVKYSCTTDQEYNHVRVMIFQWLDSSIPVMSGILQSTATGLAPFSGKFVTNSQSIRVLHDSTFTVAPSAGGDTTVLGNGFHDRSVYIPGRKLAKVKFNATTNAIQHGNIFIMFVSDDILTSYPQLTWYSRISFTD